MRKEYIKKAKRIVIKIGSGVIATPRKGINRDILSNLAENVASLRNLGLEIVIVSSGAIACGLEVLGLTKRPEDIATKQAIAAIGQPVLMEIYKEFFNRFGLEVAQILLSKHDLIGSRKRFINTRNTFNALRGMKVIPVVNENDSVAVDEIKFGDNDTLSSYVAGLIGADLLIMLSDIDGLYLDDPARSPGSDVILEVSARDPVLSKISKGGTSFFGTGGITSKIEAAKMAAKFGIPTIIANGKRKNILMDIFQGKKYGTFIFPEERLKGKRRWIGFYSTPKGRIFVDSGAKDALLTKGKSLLPSGIIKVEGSFKRGDVVYISDEAGNDFAKGLTNYSSEEVKKIMGKNSREISNILGYKYRDEVVHRDDMYVDSFFISKNS